MSEAAGVDIIDENGGGPRVRLRNPQRPKQLIIAPVVYCAFGALA